jgi:hypothetical protein
VAGVSGKVVGAGGTGFSAEVRIEGLEETVAALRALAPEVQRGFLRSLKTVGDALKADADAAAPAHAKGGYVVKLKQRGKQVGVKVAARAGSTAGRNAAIFEFAGARGLSKTGGPITGQGAAMVRWLDGYGRPGRFLWGSWDRHKAEAEAAVRGAMAEAERIIQEKLAAAGEEL